MTEAKPVEQKEMHFTYAVDQKVSVNAYFDTEISGETVRFQITARHGSKAPVIVEALDAVIAAYAELRGKYPRPTIHDFAPTGVQKQQEPARVSLDDNGNEQPPINSFIAETLSVSNTDGKTFFKVKEVKGGKFAQWGVTVWPEVLKAAGLNIADGQPAPDIKGYTVEYVDFQKDGKTMHKVTRLLQPK